MATGQQSCGPGNQTLGVLERRRDHVLRLHETDFATQARQTFRPATIRELRVETPRTSRRGSQDIPDSLRPPLVVAAPSVSRAASGERAETSPRETDEHPSLMERTLDRPSRRARPSPSLSPRNPAG